MQGRTFVNLKFEALPERPISLEVDICRKSVEGKNKKNHPMLAEADIISGDVARLQETLEITHLDVCLLAAEEVKRFSGLFFTVFPS